MKKEVAEAWVKDLRTNPPQAKGCLHDGKGHCCLGRLILVLGGSFEECSGAYYDVSPDGKLRYERLILSLWAQVQSGMCSATGVVEDNGGTVFELSVLNDRGKSFLEIADLIEANYERL